MRARRRSADGGLRALSVADVVDQLGKLGNQPYRHIEGRQPLPCLTLQFDRPRKAGILHKNVASPLLALNYAPLVAQDLPLRPVRFDRVRKF